MLSKKIAPALIIVMFANSGFAQTTAEQRIQDSVIGWWSDNYWDRHWKTPADANGKKIETHLNKMVEWMKKSYTPVGGLGTVTRYKNAWGYGVNFMVWNVSHNKQWTDKNGNFRPIPEENTKFYIAANKIFGAYPLYFLNSSKQFLFTWEAEGYNENYSDRMNRRPEGIHPNASGFITVKNSMQNIMLAPGNKLPFVAVTKGELLQLSDEKLADSFPKANDFDKGVITRVRKNIAQLQQKYRNSLDEVALVRYLQPTMYMYDNTDPFEISKIERERKFGFIVYKFPPALIAKLGDATPQWITVSLPYETRENGNQLYEMYTAITQNLNYEYMYNYFFDPEKISGKAYSPTNEDQLKARLNVYRSNYRESLAAKPAEASGSKNTNPNAWFADDFSGNTAGIKPKNWFFNTYSKHCIVATPKNEKGNWIQMGYFNPFRPSLLKYPLPKDFAIDFDVVTDEGFTVRTGGSIMLTLNTRKVSNTGTESYNGPGQALDIDIIPGVSSEHDYRGKVDAWLKSSPSKNVQHHNEGAREQVVLTEFSDVKRKIHVSVKVKNGIVAVFINGKEMSNSTRYQLSYGDKCVTCGFETDALINSVSWKATTNENADKVNVYLGNVVVTRL